MTIKFAESILDGIVDQNGHCGERGISSKQFDALRPYLHETEAKPCGGWVGDRGGRIQFYEWKAEGYVGRYHVRLNCMDHFNFRCVVESIDRWIDEVPSFKGSEYVGKPKQRMDLELTVIRRTSFTRPAYSYGYEEVNVYTMADSKGNCFVWKSTGFLGVDEVVETIGDREFLEWHPAEVGSRVVMRATVKEHGEYRGIKQTVLTRPTVKEVH